jgi:DNA-binding transcriptional ArsR family regulator
MEYKIPESIQIQKLRNKDHRHFVVIPFKAVLDQKVTPGNLRVLAVLAGYCNKQGFSIVGIRTLAEKLKVTYPTIQYHLQKLMKLGYVEMRPKSAYPGIRGNLRRIVYDASVKWDDVKGYMLDNEDINFIKRYNEIEKVKDV